MGTRLRIISMIAFGLALLVAPLIFVSCQGDGNGGGETAQTSNNLHRMESCNEALSYLRALEIEQMERIIDEYRDDPFGWYGDDDDELGDDDSADDDSGDDDSGDDDSTGDDDDAGRDDDDHSDTNVQEEGVDEADLVKTDGERLVLVTNGHLLVFDPKPADQTTELGRIEITGVATEMFLYADYVLVFSAVGRSQLPDDVWPDLDVEQLPREVLKLTVVDISDPAAMQLVREDYVEGYYLSSRRVDNGVRVALWSSDKGPDYKTWIDPSPYCDEYWENCDFDAINAAYDALERENRELIESSELESWMPRLYQIVHTPQGEQISSGTLSDCTDLYRPSNSQGTDSLSVISIDMKDPAAKQHDIGLIADGSIVYASTSALYVTTDPWQAWDWFEDYDPDSSLIHKFDIASTASEAIYVGTGEVEGWVLNQFSMSEYQDYLRIATTTGNWSGEQANHVFVLEQGSMQLTVVGALRDIAPGEEIRSARFLGDRGFLVTFEQIDPLFTLDMSDPTAPAVVGELQMPGYSAYLHPFGEDYLLGFGLQGDQWGDTWGVKLVLFDVSDFAAPTILHQENIGNYDGRSLANQDHKAFLYYASKDLLAFPYSEWGYGDDDDDDDLKYGEDYHALMIYRATVEQGFTHLHDVDHSDFTGETGSDPLYGNNNVLRSVVIGDYIYSISEAALVVTDMDSWDDVLAIDLPYRDPWTGYDDDDDDDEVWPDDDDDPDPA
ncbi:MAG: beta-propeller domain-containing protein [Candidatus Alcyoniella australis]|nr:beta-propeller domain-containing protein [Candidatus Alcyoniella australis]